MSLRKVLGIVLIVAGVAALVYGGFSFTKETHDASLGPLHLEYKEKQHVQVPTWAGVAAVVVGTGLLAFGGKR